MALRYIDTQERWKGERIGGIAHPRDIATKWSAAELASIGLEAVPPPAASPPSADPNDYPLTRRQFKTLVNYLGIKASILSAIGAIPDAFERAAALAAFEDADTYDRDDPLFTRLAPAVWPDDTEAQHKQRIDDAWMLAKDTPL